MARSPLGSGSGRGNRPKNPFGPSVRKTNPLGARAAKPPKPSHLDKPKNYGQAASNQALALQALAERRCLTFQYDGLPRVAEVHTVGFTTADRPAMNVWQVDGQSEDGPIPDWRTFCFDECFNVGLSDLPSAAPRPDFKKGAKQFRRIIAEA